MVIEKKQLTKTKATSSTNTFTSIEYNSLTNFQITITTITFYKVPRLSTIKTTFFDLFPDFISHAFNESLYPDCSHLLEIIELTEV